MSDRLTEALAWVDRFPNARMGIETRPVVAAARAYSEGEDIRWCEEHQASGSKILCLRSVLIEGRGKPCRMVSRRVSPTIKEEENDENAHC